MKMSSILASLNENNQKSQKSKRFSLPKCFQLSGIKRSLFPCKSNPNTNHENYVMFSYDTTSSSSTLVNSNHEQKTAIFKAIESPITSTMIEPSPPTRRHQHQNGAYETMISRIESSDSSSTLIIEPATCRYADLEISRNFSHNNDHTVEFMQSSRISDYDDITIVKHNNSPVSNYTNYNYDEISMISNEYYLQSTKLSNCDETSSSCAQCRLTPPHHLPTMTTISTDNTTPKQHSTMLSSSPPHLSNLEESSIMSTSHSSDQASNLESIIQSLTMLIDEEEHEGGKNETYVCSADYEATFVDDLSVQFADTVKILRDNNDDWLFVQLSGDGRCGFVPRTIVLDLKQFVRQLKEQHYSLIANNQSLASSLVLQ